eukprot:3351182-Pleurochrysis_carterae.AAC.2
MDILRYFYGQLHIIMRSAERHHMCDSEHNATRGLRNFRENSAHKTRFWPPQGCARGAATAAALRLRREQQLSTSRTVPAGKHHHIVRLAPTVPANSVAYSDYKSS